MAKDKEFLYEAVQDLGTVASYLEALAEGFRKGTLTLGHKDDEFVIRPQGLVGFAVDAKQKGPRRKLTIKFGWKEKPEVDEPDRAPLVISSPGEDD